MKMRLRIFYRFAVWRTGVVEEHRCTETVDDVALCPPKPEEVGDVAVGVTVVGFLLRSARSIVLDDAGAAPDGVQCVAAGGVDGRGSDEEAREKVFAVGERAMLALSIARGQGRRH